eukprot:UN03308
MASPGFDQEWHEAEVLRRTDDGKYEVQFDDGTKVLRGKDQLQLTDDQQKTAEKTKQLGLVNTT